MATDVPAGVVVVIIAPGAVVVIAPGADSQRRTDGWNEIDFSLILPMQVGCADQAPLVHMMRELPARLNEGIHK